MNDRLHFHRKGWPGPLLCVVGARPNYMKMAPLLRAFRTDAGCRRRCWCTPASTTTSRSTTGCSPTCELPAPDVNLEVGSGSHAVQTAEVMKRFEPVLAAVQAVVRDRRGRRQLDAGLHPGGDQAARRRWCTSKPGCAASTAACPRRSTASSPTRSPTCSTPPSAAPHEQPRARGHRAGSGCISSAT